LWFVVAVHDFFQAATNWEISDGTRDRLWAAIEKILDGYSRGTRHGIRMDPEDGLLRAGEAGLQLTWMDARVGDRVITPRIGKPVEIQALWINALWVGQSFSAHWKSLFAKASETFVVRFWNEARGQLFDVIDVDHRAGAVDPLLRPNQIFAVGGLPLNLLPMEQARRVVDAVEAALSTPMGLRSLAPGEPGYV